MRHLATFLLALFTFVALTGCGSDAAPGPADEMKPTNADVPAGSGTNDTPKAAEPGSDTTN